jgi:proteasome lid subunit RPN8/RPN11
VDEIPEARYTIKSTELLEIMDEIEKEGIELIGFYHSHPLGPSYPSMIDKNRVSWPGYSYLIVSLLGKCSVTSWIWNGEKFEIEEILIR